MASLRYAFLSLGSETTKRDALNVRGLWLYAEEVVQLGVFRGHGGKRYEEKRKDEQPTTTRALRENKAVFLIIPNGLEIPF